MPVTGVAVYAYVVARRLFNGGATLTLPAGSPTSLSPSGCPFVTGDFSPPSALLLVHFLLLLWFLSATEGSSEASQQSAVRASRTDWTRAAVGLDEERGGWT